MRYQMRFIFFFFNDTATTEIYTLSLHDALPISQRLQPNELAQLRSGDHYRNCDHPGGRPGQIPTEEGRFLRTRALGGNRLSAREKVSRHFPLPFDFNFSPGFEQVLRSEERRVGEECRSRWSAY